MDDDVAKTESEPVSGPAAAECENASQTSETNENSQSPHLVKESKKEPVAENENVHSELGTDHTLSMTITEHSEADTETGMRAFELKSLGPESKTTSDKTSGQHTQYGHNTELILKSLYQNSDVSVCPTTIELLTEGFVARFLPSLLKAQSSISQIKSSQAVLIESVQQETSKFTDFQANIDLKETMVKAKQYHNKLLKLRKEMTDLHEKSKRLKKRAVKLQQQKQKEELTRAHNMEKEFEKERMLTARLAPAQE